MSDTDFPTLDDEQSRHVHEQTRQNLTTRQADYRRMRTLAWLTLATIVVFAVVDVFVHAPLWVLVAMVIWLGLTVYTLLWRLPRWAAVLADWEQMQTSAERRPVRDLRPTARSHE